MGQAADVGALWIVGFVAALASMYYIAFRIEPHWASKDGRRFLCNAQPISVHGEVEGRARETRVIVRPDGWLQLDQKRRMRKRVSEVWAVSGRSPDPPPRRAVYLLRSRGDDGSAGQMALRLPSTSRAVAVLDALIERQR